MLYIFRQSTIYSKRNKRCKIKLNHLHYIIFFFKTHKNLVLKYFRKKTFSSRFVIKENLIG